VYVHVCTCACFVHVSKISSEKVRQGRPGGTPYHPWPPSGIGSTKLTVALAAAAAAGEPITIDSEEEGEQGQAAAPKKRGRAKRGSEDGGGWVEW